MITLDDIYGKLVEVENKIIASASGQPATVPISGPKSIAEARAEKDADPENLSFTFDGTEFTFTRKTMFGNQVWKTVWTGK